MDRSELDPPVNDVLASVAERAGLGAGFVEELVRWLGDELRRDRFAQLERTGAAKEGGIELAKVFVDLPVAGSAPADGREASGVGFVAHFEFFTSRNVPEGGDEDREWLDPDGSVERSSAVADKTYSAHRRGARALFHGAVLMGGPGQGKSTLGQMLCQVHRAWLMKPHVERVADAIRPLVEELTQPSYVVERPRKCRLPVQISLAEAAAWLSVNARTGSDATPRLLRFLDDLAEKRGISLGAGALLAWLRQGDWLLVLDGLDEVPVTAGRDVLLAEIRALLDALRDSRARGRVLITTRPQGYRDELQDVVSGVTLHLVRLDKHRALEYAKRLAAERYAATPEQRDRVVERLRQAAEQPTTTRLLGTPLQVTILAALVDGIGRAPGERWSLFTEYYRVAYDRERERFEGSPATRDIASVLSHYRKHIDKIHAHVALLLHVEGEHAGKTEAAIGLDRFEQVVDAVLAEDEIDAARRAQLGAVLRRTVMERLVLLTERIPEKIQFDVRAIQEYFVAQALAARGEETAQRRALQVARSPSFREPLLFLASKAFAELSDLRDFMTGPLCRHLDEDPELLGRESRAGAALALEMLEDGSAVKQSKYVRRLMERAVELLDRPPHEIEVRVARAAWLDEDAAVDAMAVLKDAISIRIRKAEPADRLGAWVALLALVERGVDWAVSLADEGWSLMRGHRREVLWALLEAKCPASAWLDAHLSTSLDEIGPDDVQGLDPFAGYYRAARTKALPGAITAALLDATTIKTETSAGEADLPVTFRCVSAFPPDDEKDRWSELAALNDAPPSWVPFVAAARFSRQPTAAELAVALEQIAASWTDGFATSRGAKRLPWPIAACLEASESSQDLTEFARRAREGSLGDTADWQTAEKSWSEGKRKEVEDLQSPSARWPLSSALTGNAVPVLASVRWWSLGVVEPEASLTSMLALLRPEDPGPLRRLWADVLETMLCRMATVGDELSRPFTIADLTLVWENVSVVALQSLVPLSPWSRESDAWAELIHTTAMREKLGIGEARSFDRLCGWVGTAFARRPELTGLLGALALLACQGASTPIEPSLLDPARFTTSRAATNARLVQLAQPSMTADRAEALIAAIAAAESDHPHPLSLALWIAEKLPAENPARAAILESLWRHLPPAQWGHREAVREAFVSALRRSSGLEDPRVWDQQKLPLPRPDVTIGDRRPSSRPEARPVHIDSIRFQNLRIFADFKLTPEKPTNGDGQWIVLVGANGRGKTTALRGVALALVDVISQPTACLRARSTSPGAASARRPTPRSPWMSRSADSITARASPMTTTAATSSGSRKTSTWTGPSCPRSSATDAAADRPWAAPDGRSRTSPEQSCIHSSTKPGI